METLTPLIAFAVIATFTPGGATTLVTASGAHFGFRRSVPLMVGSATGLATVAAAASAGLGSLLLALPILQIAMKAVGSVYLLWLAWRIGRRGAPQRAGAVARPTGFVGGTWLQWQNPKGWAMTLGAAASFATLADGPARLAILLSVTFGTAAGVSLVLWCIAGQILARLLRSDRQWQILNAVLGVLLAASILQMWL